MQIRYSNLLRLKNTADLILSVYSWKAIQKFIIVTIVTYPFTALNSVPVTKSWSPCNSHRSAPCCLSTRLSMACKHKCIYSHDYLRRVHMGLPVLARLSIYIRLSKQCTHKLHILIRLSKQCTHKTAYPHKTIKAVCTQGYICS